MHLRRGWGCEARWKRVECDPSDFIWQAWRMKPTATTSRCQRLTRHFSSKSLLHRRAFVVGSVLQTYYMGVTMALDPRLRVRPVIVRSIPMYKTRIAATVLML